MSNFKTEKPYMYLISHVSVSSIWTVFCCYKSDINVQMLYQHRKPAGQNYILVNKAGIPACQVKWIFNLVVPLLDVMTRVALLYEYLDGLTGAGEDSQHEGSVAISVLLLQQGRDISICLILLGPEEMIENDVNNLMVSLFSSSVQNCLFLIIFDADVRSFFCNI